jgi:hypothetical protein
MIRTFFAATGLMLGLASLAHASTPTLSPKEREEAIQLVSKLGNPSFKVREDAANRLVRFGRAVEPVLRQGLAYPEAEVRRRCERLIPLAVNYDLEKQIAAFLADPDEKKPSVLPGWAKFKAVTGGGETARSMFVDMHRIDTEYMEQIEKDPTAAVEKLKARAEGVYNSMIRGGWGRTSVTADQAAFLLYPYLALQPKVDTTTQMYFMNSIQNMAYQPNGKQVLKDNATIRKMLVSYLDHPLTSWTGQNFFLIGQLELPEGVEIARKALKGKPDNYAKSTAIGLLAKLGTKANLADIEPFLKDDGSCGTVQFGNNVRITTQVRDVALATSVQLSGQPLTDYNFPYLKMFPQVANVQVFMSPSVFGFSDEVTRNAAFKKWNEFREKTKK